MRTLVGGSRRAWVGIVFAMLMATAARSSAGSGSNCTVYCSGCWVTVSNCTGGCSGSSNGIECEVSGDGCSSAECGCDGSGGECWVY